MGDLWWFRSRSEYAPSIRVEEVVTPPPVVAFLQRDDDQFRIMSLEQWEVAGPRNETITEFAQVHASSLWGIDSADQYESLMLRRYFLVREGLTFELLDSPESVSRLQEFLGALNVKYVIAPASKTLNGWEKVYESPRASTWRNPWIQPRAFLVWNVIPEQLKERAE